MSNLQNNLMFEETYLDKSLKYDYHGNKYSLFIGGLDPGTSEDEIVKNIESIGVTDIIDVKIQRNELLESKRYAEVHLFSIESIQRIKSGYIDHKNVFSFNKSSKSFLEKNYRKLQTRSKDVSDSKRETNLADIKSINADKKLVFFIETSSYIMTCLIYILSFSKVNLYMIKITKLKL